MTDSKEKAVSIRQLWSSDHDELKAHMLRLSPQARQLRFGGAVRDEFIVKYIEQIGQWNSVIFGAFIHGELKAAAELRGVMETWSGQAEAAFSVEDEYQNRGIGDALMRRVIAAAQNRGVRSLYMICLKENGRMQHLAKKHHAELRYISGDVEATLNTPWPTADSISEEMIGEAQSFITAIFEWPRHYRKAS